MKKIIGMTGTHERDGTVTLTYNSQHGYSDCEDGKLLPCNTCDAVYEVPGKVVAFNCDECVQHRDTCDDMDCQHQVHKSRSGPPPYDAISATGAYDRD